MIVTFITRSRDAKLSRLKNKNKEVKNAPENEEDEEFDNDADEDAIGEESIEESSTVKKITPKLETNNSVEILHNGEKKRDGLALIDETPTASPIKIARMENESSVRGQFKAERVCRLSIQVNCCDFISMYFSK